MDKKKRIEYFSRNIINSQENYIEYLHFLSKGNIYVLSHEAQIEVYSQNKSVSILNTITGWNKAGYGVKNGENPIIVQNGEKQMKLFDIAQTGRKDKSLEKENLSWTGEAAAKSGISNHNFFLGQNDNSVFTETEQNINKILEEFSSDKKTHWKDFALSSFIYVINTRLGETNKWEKPEDKRFFSEIFIDSIKSRVNGLFYMDNPILMPEYAYEIMSELSRTIRNGFRKINECIENNHYEVNSNDININPRDEGSKNFSNQETKISFSEQVDASLKGKLPFYTSLKVCDTPQILLDVGCEQLPMLYTQKHMKNAIKPFNEKKHFHGLEVEQIKKLPTMLAEPMMIFDSVSREDSIIVVSSEYASLNNPIVISIKPNGKGRYEIEDISSNFITSVYPKDNFIDFFKKELNSDNLLYLNKVKSQELFERWGVQSSELTNNLNFDTIIHQSRNIVNSKSQENKQLSLFDEDNKTEANEVEESRKPDNVEEIILPTITCEWSESSVFENGKTYSVYEFDRLMKEADDRQTAGYKAAIRKYGSLYKLLYENEDNEYAEFIGFYKTKFNVNMPDGIIYTERQDIGDGDGGVIDFLSRIPQYAEMVTILEKARDIEKSRIEQTVEHTNSNITENPRDEGLETEKNVLNQTIISVTGDKSRYQANISVIRTLKQLEAEKRLPSTEYEIETLKNYQGWGGCQNAFDIRKENWSKEYEELKELLDDKEYQEARASVNTAFYTSPKVIESIYTILRNMGFTGGRILDPAMGTGRFYQHMPEDIKNSSELYGVEIDGISGRIAKMLNPQAHIDIMGYEDTTYQKGSFDLVVGNIPFGDINIDRYKIHDYFIIKSLEMLRDGGIMALITSKGTMDKRYSKVREDIDAQAQLAAAIRLPRGTFGDTDVTSDILFFVKRKKEESIVSEWTEVENDENGIPINRYFINNPDMILGKMRYSSIYGGDSVTECVTEDSRDGIINKLEKLSSEINTGYEYIKNTEVLPDVIIKETYNDSMDFDSINAEYDIKPYTYTIYNDILYFREENQLIPYKTYIETTGERKYSEKKEHIVRDMCEIKIILISLIDAMKRNCTDEELNELQEKLNEKYDVFAEKYGSINKNISIYGDDVQSSLLASIEKKTIKVENGKELTEYSKEAVFDTRTIQYTKDTEKYDNFTDALCGSINVFDRVDMEYISGHTGRTKEEAAEELLEGGEIFLNPDKIYRGYGYYEAFEIREVYLSGNVRKKLEIAEKYFEKNNDKYGALNVNELKRVLPEWITYGDIKISIGSNIIRPEDYKKFLEEILELGSWEKNSFKVEYEQVTSSYYLNKKSFYGFNNHEKYGTKRINAAEIFENLLNNRSVEVRDAHINQDGSKKYVVNEEETILAKSKAEDIVREWENWLFKDEERIQYYEDKYNNIFNSEIIPEYSGDKLTIPFMSGDITLRPHQKSAITRAIRGNLLLAHPVGAGKTFVMAGAAMKLKSIGAASKPLIVVPNSLVGQIAADFMKMFPSANVLATSEKDFQTKNRKRFISKIAVGNYDAIIMGHSQFGLIGISPERQRDELNQSVKRIENLIMNTHESDRFTIKQLEKTKKSYQDKITKLMNIEKKDMEIYFEDLGVDALMIDEAHEYKNLEVLTKMSRIAGFQTAASQKSYDLYMKCKYIREIKGERNILFSTGTPLSNTICEMYTWQRYLSEEKLAEKNINNFDDWVSLFGKIENVWEVAPEGDKFQSRRKISKFRNIPELKKMFLSFADVRQRDELSLPVPSLSNDKYNIIEVEPCVIQKEGQKNIIQRANELRSGGIDPKKDNMLRVCSDARKLAIDPRLCMNSEDYQLSRDDIGITKLDVCVSNVYDIYKETEGFKGTQVIFSDIGTPNSDKAFNVYDYLKEELILKGIPKEEICFIHDAQNNKQKLEQMHEDMRTGRKRIIIGSTSKLGTGTNIQTLLVAEHDLDVPWRPSDVEQREGRIIRQGNTNKEVRIFRYVTKGSFDSYNWNTVENKARFISQIMNSRDINTREHEDISDEVMKFAEMVAAASGNPLFTERLQVENELRKLEVIKRNFDKGKNNIKNLIEKKYPEEISQLTEKVSCMTEDEKLKNVNYENFEIVIMDKTYDDRVAAGAAIMACIKDTEKQYLEQKIGKYRGFELYCRTSISSLTGGAERNLYMIGTSGLKYTAEVTDATDKGICTRIDNRINKITLNKETMFQKLEEVKTSYEAAKEEYKTEFAEEERMNYLINRRKEIEMELTKMSDEPEHIPVKGGSR